MKNKILIFLLLLFNMIGFSQVTPTEVLRIADATTAFGSNVAVGKLVYDIDADELYVCKTASVGTLTLTTGSANFTNITSEAAATNLSEGTSTETTVDVNSSTGSNATLLAASTSRAGVMTKALYDNVIANNAKNTNVSTTLEVGTKTSTTLAITSDGGADDVTLPSATTDDAGLMTATQYDKLAGIATGAEVNLDSSTEKFEEDDGTPTGHSLAHTAVTAQGCRVSVNGSTLDPAQYTLTTSTITLDIPVVQYDIVIITYFY